jgi:NAD(P)-dependent dehydrogenase (short-subunit alcohol dehydrogenase family)
MNELEGKVALVTGGGSGIGEATCILLAERGAKVVVADIDLAKATVVASGIGANAVAVQGDTSKSEDCEAMVAKAMEAFGALHIGVNNAGIGGPQMPAGDYPLDGWAAVMGVNLNGVFFSARAEIPAMLKSGGGSIVNIASILGSVGFPYSVAYVAAKHGVVGLTKTIALEYAQQGIRCNSVGPGFIRTPLLEAADPAILAGIASKHASNRLGESPEVAELIAFLASDRSSNMTGGYYLVDGGYTAQ